MIISDNTKWGGTVNQVYNLVTISNQESLTEFMKAGINSKIIKEIPYNIFAHYNTVKNFKADAFMSAIKDAAAKKYQYIAIFFDNVKFDNLSALSTIFSEAKKADIYILNPNDVTVDCIILNRIAINFIAGLQINQSQEHWEIALQQTVSKQLNVVKSFIDICYHPIDYILTYVDGSKQQWLEEYNKYSYECSGTYNKENRWRANEEILKLNIENIYKNVPWINNLYLVVSDITQVPNWVDTTKVKIILHSEIIPTEFLPTFNSCTIEMFLHNIPNLSEYFIYANDDTVILTSLGKNVFFNNYKLYNNYISINFSQNTNHHLICKNSMDICNNEFTIDNLNYIKFTHIPHAFHLSSCKHIYIIYTQLILNSITKFRSGKNFNQYIYLYYDYFKGNIQKNSKTYKYYSITTETYNINDFLNTNYDFICINDNYINTDVNNDYKIDFVFLYVDANDKEWQQIYTQYYKTTYNNENAGIIRYRDYGTLKYLFRGIEKNLPWINNVYMIVMQKSQIPSWINTKHVKIIYHENFIPNKYLPLFNSSAIEMFLCNIPKLSEYFIYGNDDIFPIKKLHIDDFFINGKLVKYIWERDYKYYWDVLRRKDYDLIYGENYNIGKVLSDQHGLTPYSKTAIKQCINEHKYDIDKSITKFRENTNYNRWIYDIYDYKHNLTTNKKMKVIKEDLVSAKLWEKLNTNNFKVVCCNDSNKATEKDIYKFKKYLEELFSKKSKYEL